MFILLLCFFKGFLVFEIRKNLDLRKILVTPKIFLKSRLHCTTVTQYSPNCSWSPDFFKHFFGIHGHGRIVLFLCHFGLATCGESYFIACSFAFLKSLHPVGFVSLKLKNKLQLNAFFPEIILKLSLHDIVN